MDAILLAAGNSVRFGENKLLYRLNGKPMYQYVLGLLYQQKMERALDQVIVVSQYDEILENIRRKFPGVETVRNPFPDPGISGSIRLGLERLEQVSAKSEACLFAVADQPRFTMASLEKVERFWREHTCEIAAASHKGRMGNPVIFDAKYYKELKRLEGDTGGKRVIKNHMDVTGLCELPGYELEDLDTLDGVCEYYFPFLKEDGHVISIVGAGGKTTLMYMLAREYARRGKRVVITTTTHIKRPGRYPVAENMAELRRLLEDNPVVAAGADASENKLKTADKMQINDYMRAADIVLIEADGAKHYPCKVPAGTEPVIPEQSDIVLGVMGMDALGKPLEEVCFRKERAMELLAVDGRHCITREDMAGILLSDRGTRKNVGDRAYYVVLNKCDDLWRCEQAEQIRELLARAGMANVACVSLRRFTDESR